MVVGLESAAPAENAFLAAVARRTRVLHLQVRGDPQAVKAAMVLPDRGQELAWVAARLLESAAAGIPLHRLAVTAMDMEQYGPRLQAVLAELLGPPQDAGGWAYNFSQGPRLAETPLFLAATLPLKFVAAGEHREDLMSLLLSPFYRGLSRYRDQTALWDRLFRERRLDQGWHFFQKAVARVSRGDRGTQLLSRLERLWASLQTPGTGEQWRQRLARAWQELEFAPASEAEMIQWGRLQALLQDLGASLASEPLEAGEFLAWLEHGAGKVLLPGPGVQEAGLQVLGLLEMRGLEFDRVFCLGLNSGSFPPPPRSLPLLTAAERRAVLGGHLPEPAPIFPGTLRYPVGRRPGPGPHPAQGNRRRRAGGQPHVPGPLGAAGDGGAEPTPPGLVAESGHPGGLCRRRDRLSRLPRQSAAHKS